MRKIEIGITAPWASSWRDTNDPIDETFGEMYDKAATAKNADPYRLPDTWLSKKSAVTLTTRELDVLRLVAEGLSNREIGERLHLGEATVKTHLLTAFPKLDAKTRTGAVTLARELGLLGG